MLLLASWVLHWRRMPAMNALECAAPEKIYPGANPVIALAGIDLTVAEGEFVALLGPSGCGKSTLLNLVAGFETPTAGRLRIFGAPERPPGPDRAVVFQEPALFPWLRVWDNVTFSPRIAGAPRAAWEADAREFIDLVGLTGFEATAPTSSRAA